MGTTTRARVVTAGTLVALAIAAIAFLSLNSSETGSSSPYLEALDRACVAEKERIVSLERETLRAHPADLRGFASTLVAVVAEWRAALHKEQAPATESPGIKRLEDALLQTLIQAGVLARLTREPGSPTAIAKQAGAVDEATAEVDQAISALGLTECADLKVAPS
ncbi:MAG: hypothetical protein ACTHN3_07225 [Solirubrobacterales bacterium]